MENISSKKVFHCGDIADLVTVSDGASEKRKKMRNSLFALAPYKLLIMKQLDNEFYLVAVCKESLDKAQLELKTNCGPIYVRTKRLEVVDAPSLSLCAEMVLEEKNQSIRRIYDSNFEIKKKVIQKQREKRKICRQQQQKKMVANQQKKQARRELEAKYKRAYEIAVINNDRHTMKKIVEKVGGVPGQGTGKNTKVACSSYTHINPKPYSGGRFTPK